MLGIFYRYHNAWNATLLSFTSFLYTARQERRVGLYIYLILLINNIFKNSFIICSRVCWGLFTESEYRRSIARPGDGDRDHVFNINFNKAQAKVAEALQVNRNSPALGTTSIEEKSVWLRFLYVAWPLAPRVTDNNNKPEDKFKMVFKSIMRTYQ